VSPLEITYIVALEILILGFVASYLPLSLVVILAIFMLGVWFFTGKRSHLLWIIPIIFLMRVLVSVDTGVHFQGEELILKVDGTRGKVEKINGRIPKKNIYIPGNFLEEGKSQLMGRLDKVENSSGREYFYIESPEVEVIPRGIVNGYLDGKINGLTRNYSEDMNQFYRAVIMGDKNGLSDEVKDMFSYTGTSHLIVISGLHIGVIIAIIIFFSSKLPLGRDIRYFIAAVILTLYTAGVGLAPSVLRAYIMGMCYIGGELLYEKSDPQKSLSLAFIISLLINPVAIKELSFQMSFMAVFSILYVYPKVEKKFAYVFKHKILKNILLFAVMSLTIQIFLTPIFLVYFRSIPVFSFLVNLVAIPLGVVFVQTAFGALLLSTLGLGWILMPTVNISYYILVKFIDISSKIPGLTIGYYGVKKNGMIFILYLVILGMVFFKGYRKFLVVIPILTIFFLKSPTSPDTIKYKGMVYYRDPGFLVINRPISDGDIFFMRDRGIDGIEAVITTSIVGEKIKKILKISQVVKLVEGDEVEIGERSFRNSNGKVLELEKIEKNSQI
jgi:competence protein ComEC